MNPDAWKLVAALGALFLAVVTGPLLWAIRAESKAIRMEFKADLTEFKSELKTQLGEIKTDMAQMEARLNQRIDTRLVHR